MMVFKEFVLVVISSLITKVEPLTCLQCNNAPQPRHCDTVSTCDSDEICGVEEISNSFGDVLYNVGCMKNSKCWSSNNTNHCIECCASDLCNAKGCGEAGYPQARGPVCYNCPLHTDQKLCHKFDICGIGEVCMIDARRQFGDLVYSSSCSDDHACRHTMVSGTQVVGRDLDQTSGGNDAESRSLREYVCHACCDSDLCNTNCSGDAIQRACDPSPCAHGICHEEGSAFYCKCDHGYSGKYCDVEVHRAVDCYDILRMNASATSGVYNISLWRSHTKLKVLCDMDIDNGGWTVFQRRVNGSVSFNRNFSKYENGFGTLAGEFWLGLKYVEEMTGQDISELRIDLTGADNTKVYEVFRNFSLGVAPGYRLQIERGTGTAGDQDGLSYNKNADFVTLDRHDYNGCAKKSHSGWWFTSCSFTNLNADYLTPGTSVSDAGFEYYDFKRGYTLKESKMMFRRMHI